MNCYSLEYSDLSLSIYEPQMILAFRESSLMLYFLLVRDPSTELNFSKYILCETRTRPRDYLFPILPQTFYMDLVSYLKSISVFEALAGSNVYIFQCPV